MPVICTGRQPNSDVYVIGPELQFNSDGTRIAPERQQYIWIPQVLQKLHVDKVIAPHSTIPEVYHPFRSLLKAMKELSGDNFLGSIYMLGECILHATCVFDFITPRAHARARGYVIGRGVYILYIISLHFFLEPIFYLPKYSLSEV